MIRPLALAGLAVFALGACDDIDGPVTQPLPTNLTCKVPDHTPARIASGSVTQVVFDNSTLVAAFNARGDYNGLAAACRSDSGISGDWTFEVNNEPALYISAFEELDGNFDLLSSSVNILIQDGDTLETFVGTDFQSGNATVLSTGPNYSIELSGYAVNANGRTLNITATMSAQQ